MFRDDYLKYLKKQIELLNASDVYNRTVNVTDEVDFNIEHPSDVQIKVIFGSASPIEGVLQTFTMNVTLEIYGELGGGSYGEELACELVDLINQRASKLGDSNVYTRLNYPIIVNPFHESQNNYRVHSTCVGYVVYSQDELADGIASIEYKNGMLNSSVVVKLIAPQFSRNDNLSPRLTKNGMYQFSEGVSYNAQFSFTLKQGDAFTKMVLGHIAGASTMPLLTITMGNSTFTNYKVSTANYILDENTKLVTIVLDLAKNEVDY